MSDFRAPTDTTAAGSPLALTCRECASGHLDVPDMPRGDDAVECLACGTWFTYAELEGHAADDARRLLTQLFPTFVTG